MKCIYCGKEVENGLEICPHCGMILSLGDENTEATIPEYTPNVFSSDRRKNKKDEKAKELEISEVEETVPVVESIPEFVPAAYDFTPSTEEKEEPEQQNQTEETAVEAVAENVEASAQEAESAEEVTAEDEAQAIEEAEEISEEETATEEVTEEAAEDVEYPEFNDFAETDGEYEDVEKIISVNEQENEQPVIVPVSEAEDKDEEDNEDEDEDDDDDDDGIYVKSSGNKSSIITIVALCIVLVCLVAAGGYVIKNVLPDKQPSKPSVSVDADATEDDAATDEVADVTDETDASDENTTVPSTVEPATTDETTTDEEATDETTSDKSETDETTSEVSTTKPTTAKPTTTKPTTTKPTTTKPTTTKPTTTKPTTTKPTTTKPTTTKPTTSDRYGFQNVDLRAPKSYLSKSYKAYVTASSLTVRADSSKTAPMSFYLPKGSEVVVKAKENGFCYVYSTRYGKHGWVSASYISTSRPVESTTKTSSGTVKYDVSGSGETKYTTTVLNMRKGPATSYGVSSVIATGYPVKIIGYKSGVSGWAYVTDLTTGKTGWVSTAYLKS